MNQPPDNTPDQTPDYIPEPSAQPPRAPQFFDQIQAEIKAQNRHVQNIESRIGELNFEREQVQQGIKQLKNSGTLVRTLRKKLIELRDTLKRTTETQRHYLGHVEKLGAIETLQPLLQEIQESFAQRAALGREIQAYIRQSEEEASLCAEVSTLLNVWSEQTNASTAKTPEIEVSETVAEPPRASAPSTPASSLENLGETNIEPADFEIDSFFPEASDLDAGDELPVDARDTLDSRSYGDSTVISFPDRHPAPRQNDSTE